MADVMILKGDFSSRALEQREMLISYLLLVLTLEKLTNMYGSLF